MNPPIDALYILHCADDAACQTCGNPVTGEDHAAFVFWEGSLTYELQDNPPEWRPSPFGEGFPIPGDNGPSRVAYRLNDAATVQVHSGPNHGQWTPCFDVTITIEGLPYSTWICRREVKNPCDTNFMLDISS